MANIDDMSIEEKIEALRECVSKAQVGAENPGSPEYEFLLNSKLGDDRGQTLSYYSNLLRNAPTLLVRLGDLDMDVRQQTIIDLNNKLNEALAAFPKSEERGSR